MPFEFVLASAFLTVGAVVVATRVDEISKRRSLYVPEAEFDKIKR
jgi:hypothetical protein